MRPILFLWKITTTVRSQWTVCLSQFGQLLVSRVTGEVRTGTHMDGNGVNQDVAKS